LRGKHVHLFESPGIHESRFLRAARAALDGGYADEVVLLARHHDSLPVEETLEAGLRVRRIPLRSRGLPANKALAVAKIAEAHWRFRSAARAERPTLLVAHSLSPLAPALAVGRELGVPVVYDAHELETERNGLHGVKQWIERQMERRLIKNCDAVICVSDAIADWYADAYGMARPTVVRNIPSTVGSVPPRAESPLRKKLGLGPQALIFLYQGGLFRGRRIEQILAAFAGVAAADRHLVFMGYGELESQVRHAAAASAGRVHFLPAVPPGEVLAHTAGADVGICGVENICLSYYCSLPNKFFEYLHAGIGVIAPDFPELRAVTETYGCGWVVGEETSAWQRLFATLTRSAVDHAQARAREARSEFTWEAEAGRLRTLYNKLKIHRREKK
jgi:glycosyltransferase involved in cell wall biosynthesis